MKKKNMETKAKMVVFEIRIDEDGDSSVVYPSCLHDSETLSKEIDIFANYFLACLEHATK